MTNYENHRKVPASVLLYAVNSFHPMKAGVPRMLDGLVIQKVPLIPPAFFLADIQEMASEKEIDVAGLENGHSKEEFREYLLEAAKAIEDEFPEARRSGRKTTAFGWWECVQYPKESREFSLGDELPLVSGKPVVWNFEPFYPNSDASDVIRREFRRFYQSKYISGIVLYQSPEKYINATVQRLMQHLSMDQVAYASDIFHDLSKGGENSFLRQIQDDTKMPWKANQLNWKWFVEFATGVAEGLKGTRA